MTTSFEVFLPSGEVALVDIEDRTLVSEFVWFAVKRPTTVYVRGYRRGQRTSGVKVYLHQVILDTATRVDHRNGDGLDNRRSNLRNATAAENAANSAGHRDSRSGLKGVHWHQARGKWQVEIMVRGKRTFLGYFTDPDEAAAAYDGAAVAAHGEFARTNSTPTGC